MQPITPLQVVYAIFLSPHFWLDPAEPPVSAHNPFYHFNIIGILILQEIPMQPKAVSPPCRRRVAMAGTVLIFARAPGKNNRSSMARMSFHSRTKKALSPLPYFRNLVRLPVALNPWIGIECVRGRVTYLDSKANEAPP
jgi:hypothetical protein